MNVTESWQLLKVLTISTWRSRYRNSVFGLAWGVLEPLSMTLVFVLVFSLLTQGLYHGSVPYLPFVLLGQILWTLFAQGTMQGGNGILLRSGVIRKIYFPRVYISLSYILTILLTSVVNLLVFGILFVLYGLVLQWPVVLFPAILAIELLLVTGVSLLLAALFIRVEDLRYVWQLVISLGLFASPVIYQPSVVPPQYSVWYNLNPMVGIIGASRDVLMNGVWPNPWSLAYPLLLSLLIFAFGLMVFRRSEHLFAERL